jgi:hypothetical protein
MSDRRSRWTRDLSELVKRAQWAKESGYTLLRVTPAEDMLIRAELGHSFGRVLLGVPYLVEPEVAFATLLDDDDEIVARRLLPWHTIYTIIIPVAPGPNWRFEYQGHGQYVRVHE